MLINKREFAKMLSPYTFGKADARAWGKFLKVFRDVLTRELAKGNRVQTSVGIFDTYIMPEHEAYDLKTGGVCKMADKRIVRFTAPAKMKEVLNGK